MAWDDDDLVGKGEEGVVDGLDQLAGVASGQVCAAYRTGEEGVPGEQESLLGKVEADAAFRMAGGVQDGAGQAGDGYGLAMFEAGVGWSDFGGGDAEPSGLDIHHFDQGKVVLVVENGRSGEAFELLCSTDVVDVRVGDDDLLDGELMLLKNADDAGDIVAGIDDDGFAGSFVTKDGAVALERADDEDLVDHGLRVKVGANLKLVSRLKKEAKAKAKYRGSSLRSE